MPPFSNHSHTSHTTQKITKWKSSSTFVCKLVRASVGNWNLWAHNLLKSGAYLLHAASSTQQSSTHHTPSTYSYTPLSLSLSLFLYLSLTILLPSMLPYTPLQQHCHIITAPVDSTITASILASSTTLPLHSLLAPTLLLSTTTTSPHSTLHTPQSVPLLSYFFRLIVTCPIAPVDSAKVGYSTLQSKAQTAGPSTPQTLRGGLEECLNCCLLKTCVLGVATTTNDRPNTIWGVQTLGGSELTGNAPFKGNQPAQITGTEAEPQQIVAQRLLSCLQYPVP